MFYNTRWNFLASGTCVIVEQRLVGDHAYKTKCKQLNFMDKQVLSNSWEMVRDKDVKSNGDGKWRGGASKLEPTNRI